MLASNFIHGIITIGPKVSLWSPLSIIEASLVAQTIKNLPARQKTWLRSLGWEDPLEEEMATDSNILAQKIPRTQEPGGLQFMGFQRPGLTCSSR